VAARRLLAAGVEPRERVGARSGWPRLPPSSALALFPTHDEGRHLIEMNGKLASYSGALTDARVGLVRELSRAISPLALADFEQARARLDRMGAGSAAGGALDDAEGGRVGQPDPGHLDRAQHPQRGRTAARSGWRC
jgi:hypothetical protein